jgi:hypothetical protein
MIVLMSPEFVVLLNFKRSETQRLILIPLLKKGEEKRTLKNKEVIRYHHTTLRVRVKSFEKAREKMVLGWINCRPAYYITHCIALPNF